MPTTDTYVAVSDIKHGTAGDDGNVEEVTFARGEKVEGLGKEHMVALWGAGAIAVEGSPQDPNTWPELNEVQNTTPRFVEDVLTAQITATGAPEGTDIPKTQRGRPVPDDPEALLRGSTNQDEGEGRSVVEPTPPAQVTSTTTPATSEGKVSENQGKANEAEKDANEEQD